MKKKSAIYFWTEATQIQPAHLMHWEHRGSNGWNAKQEVSKLMFETRELTWGRDELSFFPPAPAGDMKVAHNWTSPGQR